MEVELVKWPVALLGTLLMLGLLAPKRTDAQEGDAALRLRGQAIERLIAQHGDPSRHEFIQRHVSPELIESMGRDNLLSLLRRLQEACDPAADVLWQPRPEDGLRIEFHHRRRVSAVELQVESGAPGLIRSLTLALEAEPKVAASGDAEPMSVPPLRWDSLEAQLEEAAKTGFSGTVLVAREGEIVAHRAFGMADAVQGIVNRTETLFAIGSTPIDFTYAAVLKLVDTGKLRLEDPITRFFEDVPEAKRTITVAHLARGQSGLPDFHDIPGVDADPDLAWIDRATAESRILGQPLLFEPGTDSQHSHSAWVFLAAIIERVSGASYGEFLRTNFFDPMGMTRTGLYSWVNRFPETEIAVGRGGQVVGERNSPLHWGKTSWLVMGSGGMVSTAQDLYTFAREIRSGDYLSEETRKLYAGEQAGIGGNQRGFFCATAIREDDVAILCSNDHSMDGGIEMALGRALTTLILGRNPVETAIED